MCKIMLGSRTLPNQIWNSTQKPEATDEIVIWELPFHMYNVGQLTYSIVRAK